MFEKDALKLPLQTCTVLVTNILVVWCLTYPMCTVDLEKAEYQV